MSEIIRKLKLDAYPKRLMQGLPKEVTEFETLSFEKEVKDPPYNLIFAFVFDLDEMEEKVRQTASQNLLADGGYLFLAYPKKGNKQYSFHIHRDSIFPRFGINEEDGFVPETPLKFNRMVSMNEVFTVVGLKCFLKAPAKKSANSARVDDLAAGNKSKTLYRQKEK